MKTPVFVSVRTPADDTQRVFRDAVVKAIKQEGLDPRLMDKATWDYRNPLRGVRRVMEGCNGAVIIAYARYHVAQGVERHSEGDRPLERVAFPTAWNQIEAAMAYEKGIPVLVVAENGLRRDAVLDSGRDILPLWTELDESVVRSDVFRGHLRSWKDDIDQYSSDRRDSRQLTRDLSASQVLMCLPWQDLLQVLFLVAGLVLGALAWGYKLGSGQWPFL